MNINVYEALKNGVKSADLIKSLQKEIDEADKRITAENKNREEEEATLKKHRSELADAFLSYFIALYGEPFENANPAEMEEILKEFEKENKPKPKGKGKISLTQIPNRVKFTISGNSLTDDFGLNDAFLESVKKYILKEGS